MRKKEEGEKEGKKERRKKGVKERGRIYIQVCQKCVYQKKRKTFLKI